MSAGPADGATGGGAEGVSNAGRLFAGLSLLLALLLVGMLLFGSGGGYNYKLLFETGGQLVPGNQVLVAGQPIGTINSIDLTDDAQAEVDVTLDEPLREGTTAIVRATSLSGVANRYVAITRGPDNAGELEEGTTVSGEDTTAPVDLDQLFNVFRGPERKALQQFIQGNAAIYAGKGRLANRAYKFLNPALSSSERLFAELSSDSVALERFLVEGARALGALADERDSLTRVVVDGNTALGAVANQADAVRRSLTALPGTLRQANTTFVNLRTTLDDLDPFVEASLPATVDLAPFLRRLRGVAKKSNPVFTDLAKVVKRDGSANDLRDSLKDLPGVRDSGDTAFPASVAAMDASQPNFAFARPYMPDLLGFISKLGEAGSYYDANGHYVRVQPAAANIFDFDGVGTLDPLYTDRAAQYDAIDFGIYRRCPGGGTQQAADLSNPFLDDGNLTLADCDPSDLPPG